MSTQIVRPSRPPSKSEEVRQQEESDASVETLNAFLTVGVFALSGQTHDELKGEFIAATTAGTSYRWSGQANDVRPVLSFPNGVFPGLADTLTSSLEKTFSVFDCSVSAKLRASDCVVDEILFSNKSASDLPNV
jgi:hypothetical protein